MNAQNLVGLKIQKDYEGNLYVLVPELRNDDRVIFETVYLSIATEPAENVEEPYFRNHSLFN